MPPQGRGADAEDVGGLFFVASGVGQDLVDVAVGQGFQAGKVAVDAVGGRGGQVGLREMGGVDTFVSGEDQAVFHPVFELADVSGPRVVQKGALCGRGEPRVVGGAFF